MNPNYFNPFFTVKVMDGLFISNQTAAKEQQFIMNNKFSLIINTCPRQFKILSVPSLYKVNNFHWHNIKGQMIDKININNFQPYFQQITKNIDQGHGTLIVSDRGHSRSITFTLLYLMTRFQWDLFKSLQYINSKRQNLQVRATYLKLLVDYDKNRNKEPQDVQSSVGRQQDFTSHIKNLNKKQKWSQENIKSVQQRLLTNTFKNTAKKRPLNQLNQVYRQTVMKGNKQTDHMRKTKSYVSNSANSTKQLKQVKKKSVNFSNQIQIIINRSAMSHIFPQYQQLSFDNNNNNSSQKNSNNNNNNINQPGIVKQRIVDFNFKKGFQNYGQQQQQQQQLQQNQQKVELVDGSIMNTNNNNNSKNSNLLNQRQKQTNQHHNRTNSSQLQRFYALSYNNNNKTNNNSNNNVNQKLSQKRSYSHDSKQVQKRNNIMNVNITNNKIMIRNSNSTKNQQTHIMPTTKKQRQIKKRNQQFSQEKDEEYEQLYTKKQDNQKYYNEFVQITQNYETPGTQTKQMTNSFYKQKNREDNSPNRNKKFQQKQKDNYQPAKKGQQKTTHKSSNSQLNNYPQTAIFKIKSNALQNLLSYKNQKSSQNYKIAQQNLKQKINEPRQQKQQTRIKPSSLKKFKINKNNNQMRNKMVSSPKKNNYNQLKERIFTEPKYQEQEEREEMFEGTLYNYKQKRRLSASRNSDLQPPNYYNHNIYQHKKTASSTLSNKIFSNIEPKRSMTPFNKKNRAATPQKSSTQVFGQKSQGNSSSSNQILSNRPLSQGKNPSFKMTNKKATTTSAIRNQQQPNKANNNIFNVNINVNIGKLQMISNNNKNMFQQKNPSLKQKQLKKQISNNNSYHLDNKKAFIQQHRPRSNSSIQNHTKLSTSNYAQNQKHTQGLVSQKFMKRLINNKLKFNQDLLKMSTNDNKIMGQNYQNQGNSQGRGMNQQQDNSELNEVIMKQRIIQKLNKKLSNKNNAKMDKRQQNSKEQHEALQNNYF